MNDKGTEDVTLITISGGSQNSSHLGFNMSGFTNISILPDQGNEVYVSEGDLKFREIVNTMDVYWIPIIFVLGKYVLHGGHQGSWSHGGTQPYRPYHQSMWEVPFIWL